MYLWHVLADAGKSEKRTLASNYYETIKISLKSDDA